MTDSLFERIRDEGAVNAAVDLLYTNVLADDRVNHWFENVDLEKQGTKMKAFLTFAFGGPSPYDGKDMRRAHSPLVPLGLGDSDFDAVMEAMAKTLTELNVPQDLLEEAAKIAQGARSDGLGR